MAHCATGIATDALKDIVITLQMTLLQNLKLAWGQDTMVDFTSLEYASEESRVNSVVALGQLYQRLATAAPIQRMSAAVMPVTGVIENSRPVRPMLPPAPTPPPANPRPVRPDSGRWSTGKASPPAIYNLFRRPKSDTAVPRRGSQESLVPQYLLPAISADKSDPGWLLKEVQTGGKDTVRQSLSSTISSDASSSIFEPNDLWQIARESPEGSMMGTPVRDPRASMSRQRVPTSTLEVATSVPQPRLLLPCEDNRFAGFCKARPPQLLSRRMSDHDSTDNLSKHRVRGSSNPASRKPSANAHAPAACTAPPCTGAARNACSKVAWPSRKAASARRTTRKCTTPPASSGAGCSCSNRTFS